MSVERKAIIESLMKEVPDLTEAEANIILDSLIDLLSRSHRIGHDVRLLGFEEKPFLFRAAETDLAPLLVH